MDVRITARHFSLDPSQKQDIEQRIIKLSQYYDGITDAQVVLDNASDSATDKTAELNVTVFRQKLAAHAEGDSLQSAMDSATKKMRRQLTRYKEKLRSKNKDIIK